MIWQELEEKVKNLLKHDKAMTVPGSGNGKSEEDVIGISTISQCKYTKKINISILHKDMQRLVKTASLQKKLPLFFTKSNGCFTFSIPDNPLLAKIITLVVTLALLEKTTEELDSCKTMDQYNILYEFVNKHLVCIMQVSDTILKNRFKYINKKLNTLYDDLTQYNLFENS